MIKIRTMIIDADQSGVDSTSSSDKELQRLDILYESIKLMKYHN